MCTTSSSAVFVSSATGRVSVLMESPGSLPGREVALAGGPAAALGVVAAGPALVPVRVGRAAPVGTAVAGAVEQQPVAEFPGGPPDLALFKGVGHLHDVRAGAVGS